MLLTQYIQHFAFKAVVLSTMLPVVHCSEYLSHSLGACAVWFRGPWRWRMQERSCLLHQTTLKLLQNNDTVSLLHTTSIVRQVW
jgi:hypothetical protein